VRSPQLPNRIVPPRSRKDVHVEIRSATRPTVRPGRFRPQSLARPRSLLRVRGRDWADELRPIHAWPHRPRLPRAPVSLGLDHQRMWRSETTTPAWDHAEGTRPGAGVVTSRMGVHRHVGVQPPAHRRHGGEGQAAETSSETPAKISSCGRLLMASATRACVEGVHRRAVEDRDAGQASRVRGPWPTKAGPGGCRRCSASGGAPTGDADRSPAEESLRFEVARHDRKRFQRPASAGSSPG